MGKSYWQGDFSNLCDKVSETAVKRGKRRSTLDDNFNKNQEDFISKNSICVANCILLETPTVNSFCKDYVEIQLQFAPLRFVVQHEN